MTDAKLKYWGEEWLLTDDMINCSECHAAQFLVNKDDDFVHGPTCPRDGPGQRPYVVAELRRREMPFYRLNTELVPQSISTMSGRDRKKWSIRIGEDEIRGDEVTTAYFRRPGAPNASDSVKDQAEKRYVESEWGSFLKSLYMRLEDVWFGSPSERKGYLHKDDSCVSIASFFDFRIADGYSGSLASSDVCI